MSSEEKPAPRPRRARPKRDAQAHDASRSLEREPADVPVRSVGSEVVAAVAAPSTASTSPPGADDTVSRPLVASAVAAAIGLAIVGTSAQSVGPWILSAGVIGLIASIHRLGRLGPA